MSKKLLVLLALIVPVLSSVPRAEISDDPDPTGIVASTLCDVQKDGYCAYVVVHDALSGTSYLEPIPPPPWEPLGDDTDPCDSKTACNKAGAKGCAAEGWGSAKNCKVGLADDDFPFDSCVCTCTSGEGYFFAICEPENAPNVSTPQ